MKFNLKKVILLATQLSNVAHAYTYSNSSFAGGRATAMGGARAALSNDASAAFENPAGLTFTAEGYQFSSSVQGQGGRSVRFESTVDGQTPVETKSDDLNGFVGFSKNIPGTDARIAFGIFTPSGQSNHQEFELNSITDLRIKKLLFQTKSDVQDILYGAAFATPINPDLSIGFRLGFARENSSSQYYQSLIAKVELNERPKEVSTTKDVYISTSQGYLSKSIQHRGVAGFGMQYRYSDTTTFGGFIQTSSIARSRTEEIVDGTSQYLLEDDSPLSKDDVTDVAYTKVYRNRYESSKSNRTVRMPFVAVVGGSWKLSPSILFAMDLSYSVPEYLENQFNRNLRDVGNLSVGLEHVLPAQLYYRLGARTNFDHDYSEKSEGQDGASRNQMDVFGLTGSVGRGTFTNGSELIGAYEFGRGRRVLVNREGTGPVYNTQLKAWFVGVAFNNELKL